MGEASNQDGQQQRLCARGSDASQHEIQLIKRAQIPLWEEPVASDFRRTYRSGDVQKRTRLRGTGLSF